MTQDSKQRFVQEFKEIRFTTDNTETIEKYKKLLEEWAKEDREEEEQKKK